MSSKCKAVSSSSWLPTHLMKSGNQKKQAMQAKQEEARKKREEARKKREEEERIQREEARKKREEEERILEEHKKKEEEEKERRYAMGYFRPGVSVSEKVRLGLERDNSNVEPTEEETIGVWKKYSTEERLLISMAKESRDRVRYLAIQEYKSWKAEHVDALLDLYLELNPPNKSDFLYHAYMTYDIKAFPLFLERGDNESALCSISFFKQYPFFTREAPLDELSEEYLEWLREEYRPVYQVNDNWTLV